MRQLSAELWGAVAVARQARELWPVASSYASTHESVCRVWEALASAVVLEGEVSGAAFSAFAASAFYGMCEEGRLPGLDITNDKQLSLIKAGEILAGEYFRLRKEAACGTSG